MEETEGSGMDERSIMEDMEDILNIVQLLEMSLKDNGDDCHIIRSVHVIHRMIKAAMDRMA